MLLFEKVVVITNVALVKKDALSPSKSSMVVTFTSLFNFDSS
jgi:hypothetical protein